MLSISDLKRGVIIVVDNQPYQVLFSQLSKQGRAGSVLTTKLKNLITGSVLERNFRQSDKFQAADVTDTYATFLYQDELGYHFMDEVSFEQYAFDAETLGEDAISYLIDEIKVKISFYEGEPISIILPPKVVLEVTQSPPGAKGNTVDSAQKTVTVETGREVKVPLFINQGDRVRINTETGLYEEKVTE